MIHKMKSFQIRLRREKSKVNNFKSIFAGLLSCVFIFSIILSTNCFAQNINFEVSVDKAKVSLVSSFQLNLNFYGTQDVPAPALPDIDGFNCRYLGPSTQISVVNGKVSSSITHVYTLLPLKTGVFTIPSFSVQYGGKSYASKPITVEVIQEAQANQSQTEQESSCEETVKSLEDKIFLVMEVDKNKAYVNEIIPVKIKLYINKLPARDIQYPELKHQGFSVDKFSEYTQHQEVLNDIMYDVIEFNTNIFALSSGEFKFGPAELKCNLIVKKTKAKSSSPFPNEDFFDNFFGLYEQYPLSLKSVSIPISIIELPQENKPADSNGAIGDYQFYVEANPKEVKVGDPITLKMIVSGKGNFRTVNNLSLDFKDDFKVYEPEIKQDTTTKTFEQVIIPKNEKVEQIPEISFSFFNPQAQEYKTIIKGPIAIKVNPIPAEEKIKVLGATEKTEEIILKKETFGMDISYIKDAPGKFKRKGEFLCKNKWFILSQIIPVWAIILTLIFKKRKERIKADARYGRRLRASRMVKRNLSRTQHLLNAEKSTEFFDAVFKTLREYIGDKFHLSIGGITVNIIEELKIRNVDHKSLEKLKICFDNCDIVRYAPATIKKEQMTVTFRLLQEIIDEFERVKT